MKRTILSAALVAVLTVTLVLGAAAGDQVSTVPRLGTGSVTVEGDVSVKGDVRVINEASVAARQTGPWRVGVDGAVTTSLPPLPFVRVGRAYEIRWVGQPAEVIVPRETYGSWVRVDTVEGGRTRVRWINLSAAGSIEERSS